MPTTGMYVLQGVIPSEIAVAPFDVKVVEVYADDGHFFTNEEVALMGGGDGVGLLLGYFSIGEAEVYRDYFSTIPAAALGPENPQWAGNYEVAYWTQEWRDVATAYLDRMIAAGYDGIYFDVVDECFTAWAQANAPGGDAVGEMVELVKYLADYAHAKDPDFKIWANNAEELLENSTYLATIDGMFKENLFYQDDGTLQPKSETSYSLSLLNLALAAGKEVVSIEYVSGATKIADVQAKAAAAGIYSYVADLDLVGVNYSGVQSWQTAEPPGSGTTDGSSLTGDAGNNLLNGGAGDDLMNGGAGDDTLNGAGGHDTLNGGTGTDRLVGGAGNDRYVTDSAKDVVVEASGEGTDTVVTSSASFTLSANVEHLTAGNAIAHTLTGNGLANVITGHDAADSLNGAGGSDTLNGGAGNDTLNGGAGTDNLAGGTGNDLYIATAGDVVVEASGGGSDTVQATTGTSFTLASQVEALVLTGSTLVEGVGNGLGNTITGNGNANTLRGLGGADTLLGLGGNDVLDGGAGTDMLTGGAGSDVFRFGALAHSTVAAPDRITDFTYSTAGYDKVDLAAIDANAGLAGNQAFAFIGGKAFSGAAGELRVTAAGTGNWLASGDVNGDAVADFAIMIQSASAPVADWFTF